MGDFGFLGLRSRMVDGSLPKGAEYVFFIEGACYRVVSRGGWFPGVRAGSVGECADDGEVERGGFEGGEVGDAGVSVGDGVVAGWAVVDHGEAGAIADLGGWEVE